MNDLSPADKKGAQAFTETTVAAIASAVASGVAVAPEAVKNTVAAAASLGVALSPETTAAAATAMAMPPATQDSGAAAAPAEAAPAEAAPAAAPAAEQPAAAADTPASAPAPAPAADAPAPAPAPTASAPAPAPSLFTAVSQALGGGAAATTTSSTISTADIVSATTADPTATFRATLPATVQTGFDLLPLAVRQQLATLNDPALASFVIQLPATQISPFLTLPSAQRQQLVGLNDSALTSFTLQLPASLVSPFLAQSATARQQLVTLNNPLLTAFTLQLSSTQVNSLLALPAATSQQLAQTNSTALAAFALQLPAVQVNGSPQPAAILMHELGIIGAGNVAAVGADTEGMNRMLTAYGALPTAVRANTERHAEATLSGVTFGPVSATTPASTLTALASNLQFNLDFDNSSNRLAQTGLAATTVAAANGGVSFPTGFGSSAAAVFNGSSSLRASNTPISSALTVAFWMNTSTDNGHSGASQWYQGNGLVDGEMGGVDTDWGVSQVGRQIAFGIGNSDTTLISTSDINTGNWVFVAGTWDTAGAMKLYINGTEEASLTGGPIDPRRADNAFFVGQDANGQAYTGSLDQIQLYDTVLTSAQIVALQALNEPEPPSSFFFTGNNGSGGVALTDVQFQSHGDLYVGATRFLQIDNTSLSSAPGFTVGGDLSHDLYLYAADRVELTGGPGGLMFSSNIRSITLAAATLNLNHVNFPEGSVASLNSKFGTTNFAGGSVFGKVNFNDVRYGGFLLGSNADLATTGVARGNLAIGTLVAPAALPTYLGVNSTQTSPTNVTGINNLLSGLPVGVSADFVSGVLGGGQAIAPVSSLTDRTALVAVSEGGVYSSNQFAIASGQSLTSSLGSAYDLRKIEIYSSWQDAGRDDFSHVTIAYSTDHGANFINLVSDLSSGFNDGQIVVNTGLFAGGTVIAAGATDVRFTFDVVENGAIGIFELSVEGTATAGSAPALFRAQLTTPEQAAFDQLAADLQLIFATLNNLDIAHFALAADPDTGLPFTDSDLRTHLQAYGTLQQDNPFAFAMVVDMAGAGLVNLSSAPDPLRWSPEAFQRMLTSWTALSTPEQAQIIALGAGEAIMDTSADYIQALLGSLSSPQSALITELGWGRYLGELAGKPTGTSVLTTANTLTTGERAVVKLFDVSPTRLTNATTRSAIGALASASNADRLLLLQLGVGQRMLNENAATPPRSFATVITSTHDFYAGLTAPQQTAARALGLGEIFYKFAASSSFPSGTTALQRVLDLTQYYTDHPELRQALQDSRIFEFSDLPITLGTNVTDTLATFSALPVRTRRYLDAAQYGESANFYKLANPPGSGTNLRGLTAINALLAGLTDAQFASLLDLDLGKAVVGGFSTSSFVELLGANPGDQLTTLLATISNYDSLPSLQKNVMRELGIIGEQNVTIIGAETEGLGRLLTAYGTLAGPLRARTEHLDEAAADNSGNGTTFDSTGEAAAAHSYFFPGISSSGTVMRSVQFVGTGDLYVGATRFLKIDNSALGSNPGFSVGAAHDLYLHAADLIDLTGTTSTNVMFSTNIRSITMAAATINLTNISFPDGSVASLNSKLGTTNFAGGSVFGKVNFNNVRYGTNVLGSDADLANKALANGNIAIGSLAAPAALPAYVAPGTNR